MVHVVIRNLNALVGLCLSSYQGQEVAVAGIRRGVSTYLGHLTGGGGHHCTATTYKQNDSKYCQKLNACYWHFCFSIHYCNVLYYFTFINPYDVIVWGGGDGQRQVRGVTWFVYVT